MSTLTDQVAGVLHDAAETHHQVYRIVDGTDPDWASWYASPQAPSRPPAAKAALDW